MPQIAPDGNYCPSTSMLNEEHESRSIIKSIDVLGRDDDNKTFYLDLYDDGSVEKKYILNKYW